MQVVAWVTAGIAAAMVLYFAVLGIRKGLAWFFVIVEQRRGNAVMVEHYNAEAGGGSGRFRVEMADGNGGWHVNASTGDRESADFIAGLDAKSSGREVRVVEF